MIRILQCVNNMHRAGLETMLMNYYRNIDREKIQFDFLTHRPERSDYDDEIEEMGGRVYYAPRLMPQNLPAYRKWMRNFFHEHPEYVIMHSHIDAMSYLPLLEGKRNGVPIRIAHSHSTSIDRDFKYPLKLYYRSRINSVTTDNFSCGKLAGDFLFSGKPYTIIPNAVEAHKFYFDRKLREDKRKELGITDEFVIGHVGRFYYPKNHKFLVDIFKELLEINPKSLLVLIGTGEKEAEIKDYVENQGLSEKVIFLGSRSDVSELYQALDVFVLPSLFEGVPLVGVEAQFSDLPCYFSTKVPTEVAFSEKAHFVPLDLGAREWARMISEETDDNRSNSAGYIVNSHYDINVAKTILENMYLDLYDSYTSKKGER